MTRDDAGEIAMQCARVAAATRSRSVADTVAAVILANQRANYEARSARMLERSAAIIARWPIAALGFAVMHNRSVGIPSLADGDHFAGMPHV